MITRWKLSLAETLAFGCTVAALTLWAVDRFQTQADASEVRESIERRISVLQERQDRVESFIHEIGKDVSYIRGRLEPKGK